MGVALFRRTRHGVALHAGWRGYARKVRSWLLGMERDTLDLMAHQGAGGTIELAGRAHVRHALADAAPAATGRKRTRHHRAHRCANPAVFVCRHGL